MNGVNKLTPKGPTPNQTQSQWIISVSLCCNAKLDAEIRGNVYIIGKKPILQALSQSPQHDVTSRPWSKSFPLPLVNFKYNCYCTAP